MPGFFAEIGTCTHSTIQLDNNFVYNEIKNKNYCLKRFTINKFLNDKCFFENSNYILIIEGVILNKKTIYKDETISWEQTIINWYKENGDTFFKIFRGSFSGLLYDKKNDKWVIFTDQIGSKFVYFSNLNDRLIVSQDISILYSYFKQNNINYSLSISSAYMLLSYGYMLEDNTLCDNIKKIMPGHYLIYEKNKLTIHQYYKLTNKPNYNKTKNEFIDEMSSKFKEATKLQFEKDKEYSYKHLVGLSGGLDSRMTSWVANDLGYKEQFNFTFSQSNYLDETIPKQIANDLKHEWIFKALDNGLFLQNIDEITKITGGNVLFFGLAHQNSFYKYLNFKDFGIVHSGQLGDVVFGTFYKSKDVNANYKFGDGAYSRKYLSKIKNFKFKLKYDNQEIFNFYNRGFAGANNGLLISQTYSETFSPFYNLDLLEFALTIPVELRFNHNIYKQWIIQKYPKAAEYIWERIKNKITIKPINIKGRELYPNQIVNLLKRKTKIGKAGLNSNKNMNPIDYWLRTNILLNNYFNNYFNENIEKIELLELKKDLTELFTTGNGSEKVQVLSLLSAIKFFFYD